MTARRQLWPNNDESGDNAFITVHQPLSENWDGTAVLVLPGGGYSKMAWVDIEGHEPAKWLAGLGVMGVVLEYRLPRGRWRAPLRDAQEAMVQIRQQHPGIKRLGVMGFSAGGHLASCVATLFTGRANRPDFWIGVYPVIDLMGGERVNEFVLGISHEGSQRSLLGEHAHTSSALKTRFSTQSQVTRNSPPCFIAHARDDIKVPVANSEVFAEACRACEVGVHTLYLDSGGHGLNDHQGPSWEAWQKEAKAWLERIRAPTYVWNDALNDACDGNSSNGDRLLERLRAQLDELQAINAALLAQL